MTLKRIETPSIGKDAHLIFSNGRPSHSLMLRLLVPSLQDSDTRAFFYACQAMTKNMASRAASVRGAGDPGSLFPEHRTYEPWGGNFLWEFWWGDPENWDVEALWKAIDGDDHWFERTLLDYWGQY